MTTPPDGRFLPDVGYLCAEGEQAFRDDEFEEAAYWYELACAGTFRETKSFEDLVARRFERYAELRKMLVWRSVQRLPVADPGHVLAVQGCVGRPNMYVQLKKLAESARSWRGAQFAIIDGVPIRRRGQAHTFFRILKKAAAQPGFTYLTLLEDDVVLAKNALDYIATTRIDDDLAFISWFSVGTCVVPRIPPTLLLEPARDYMFHQAITFPARTVHELLASDALKNWNEPHGADRIYARVFPERSVAVHYPNFVQHVGGAESLVGNNSHGHRLSPTFPGEDFDALSLIR